MPARLVALDGGPDILIDQDMVVVGRHPSCDARLDSLRLSRHHCCLTQEHGEIMVRDLGSTNGIRINGERVKVGRLRLGDELAIAIFVIASMKTRIERIPASIRVLRVRSGHAFPAQPIPLYQPKLMGERVESGTRAAPASSIPCARTSRVARRGATARAAI